MEKFELSKETTSGFKIGDQVVIDLERTTGTISSKAFSIKSPYHDESKEGFYIVHLDKPQWTSNGTSINFKHVHRNEMFLEKHIL